MITGAIKNKVDKIWTDIWAGGITQPLTVIEQLTYLMFIRALDEKEIENESLEALGVEVQKIFPQTPEGQAMRWSKFKDKDAREIYDLIRDKVFPFIKSLNGDAESAFSRYMEDALFLLPTPQVLQKVITGLEDLYEHDIKDKDTLGDLYEYMLSKLNTAGQNGQFRTRLINRRTSRQKLSTIPIENRITDRYYQKQAVRAVCDHFEKGHRKALLVMATGTGKTRTAVSLTDVLSRGGYVTNTLFLADRTALVHQAKDVFKNLLPDMSLCNLLSNKDDRNARVVFSTYPTMLNTINNMRNEDGGCIFSPAHFDLIIVDESHRSIFRKYRAIFDYFDAYLVGLTATPREDVHKSTYEFFEAEKGVPTFAYDYETAIKDGVLVPYYNIEVKTKFLTHGITYDELSPEDKERYEEDFTDEDGEMPEEILPSELNEFIFNQDTVDRVINDLMTNGLRDSSGNRVGKTIIFAQNKNHAQFIVDRFNALYPEYKGTFCRRVVCDDDYVLDLILQFKDPEKEPYIAVSVDMLDTGIDVPEIVNLVFFKRVRSKIKFWQMIGRGTRTRPDLFGPGWHKEHFYIFDYLGNFEFFREHKQEIEATVSRSTTAEVFARRIQLIFHLQAAAFAGEEYQAWRRALVTEVTRQIAGLSLERVDVRLKRKYVDKYNREEAFACLSEQDKREIIDHLADLVTTADNDDRALEFDNIMYGLMLAELEKKGSFKGLKRNVMNRAALLLKNSTSIPQVKVKIPLLKEVITEEFWEKPELLRLETIRVELRDLMKFIVEPPPDLIYTNLHDEEIDWTAGKDFRAGYDLQEYKRKVNKFIEENKDNIAIHKLRNNIPLTETDYKMLERILTGELGTKEDYERSFRDTPFGLLVRRIAKMEREAAYKAFSSFINEQNLNSDQIAFVEKVIDYIVQNGYMESPAELTKPPFDKPRSFVQLFDHKLQKEFVRIINELKENATKITS